VGQHDNYGFALTAQPGGSQGRPTTNTSSRLIVYERPAHPKCSPGAPVPDGRTIRQKLRGRDARGTGSYHAGYQRN
jgi:hypothetical protein